VPGICVDLGGFNAIVWGREGNPPTKCKTLHQYFVHFTVLSVFEQCHLSAVRLQQAVAILCFWEIGGDGDPVGIRKI
jgi:hypothetical protein